MNLMPNFSQLSKIFPELKSKPWVKYLDSTGDECGEKRLNQLLIANFLLGDLTAGKTTFARFLRDVADCLEVSMPVGHFEYVARAHIGKYSKEPNKKFLMVLHKSVPMESSPELFEVLVRRALSRLPKRKSKQKVSNPEWLKGIVRLLAGDIKKASPLRTKAEVANEVNKVLKSINPQIGTTDLVIEKMLPIKKGLTR